MNYFFREKEKLDVARKNRNFKSSDSEWEPIKENARKYAGGNVSKWLKRAGSEYVPPEAVETKPCPPDKKIN